MKLTKEMIERLETPKRAYTRKTLEGLGVDYPPIKGWKIALIGTEIDERKYAQLCESVPKQASLEFGQ